MRSDNKKFSVHCRQLKERKQIQRSKGNMHNSYNAAANFSSSSGGFMNYLWKNSTSSGNSSSQQQQSNQSSNQNGTQWSWDVDQRERKNISGVPLIHNGYNCHIFWVRKTKEK